MHARGWLTVRGEISSHIVLIQVRIIELLFDDALVLVILVVVVFLFLRSMVGVENGRGI
jgi:hypothetical protein